MQALDLHARHEPAFAEVRGGLCALMVPAPEAACAGPRRINLAKDGNGEVRAPLECSMVFGGLALE
eukprot:15474336-Alexandrium_andersonii.AAC.1